MNEHLQFCSILKRRWLPASLVFASLLILSIVRTVQEKPIYQANGQLLLKKNTTSSLTGVGNQLGQLQNSVSGNPLENEAAILRSLPLAERVISSLKLSQNPQIFLKDLEVRNNKNTDILEIYYTDTEPGKAASIVNALMKIYINNDINANRSQTKSARDFIEGQLPIRKAALRSAEEKMQRFEQQNRVLDLNAEASAIVTTLSDLEKLVATTQFELSAQNARMGSIRDLFGISSQQAVVAGFVGESPTTTSLLTQLQDVQQKIETSRLSLTDSNPVLIKLREQEVVLKKELQKHVQQSFVGKLGRLNQIENPEKIVPLRSQGLQQGILSTYATAETERLSLESRLTSISRVINSYKQRATTLPQLELQQRQLEREVAATESSYKNLLDRYQELQIAENQQVGNARIITPSAIPAVPVRSRQYINLLQGLIGGFLLAGATAFLLEKIDNTVKSDQSVKDLLDYKLLGSIPSFSDSNSTRGIPEVIVRSNPESPISEAFRILQTNLRFFNSERPIKVIVVSSAVPKEGKSTIAANLAVSISQLGRKVLLLDADLRNPNQHRIWEVSNEIGLSTVLKGESSLEQSVAKAIHNLHVMSSGGSTSNSLALLDSSQMAVLIAQAVQNYDFVIIDSPPLTLAADATILGKMSNGILLVVRPGVADSESVALSREMLDKAGQNVLGVTVNGTKLNNKYYAYKASGVGV